MVIADSTLSPARWAERVMAQTARAWHLAPLAQPMRGPRACGPSAAPRRSRLREVAHAALRPPVETVLVHSW
jgi:hypothetical protein